MRFLAFSHDSSRFLMRERTCMRTREQEEHSLNERQERGNVTRAYVLRCLMRYACARACVRASVINRIRIQKNNKKIKKHIYYFEKAIYNIGCKKQKNKNERK